MTQEDAELLAELFEVFSAEAEEHLRSLNERVAQLERVTDPTERATLLREVFRNAHTLKGAAGAVGLDEVADLAHRLESLFARMQEDSYIHDAKGFDSVYRTLDGIAALVVNATGGGNSKVDIEDIQTGLEAVGETSDPEDTPERRTPEESIRVSISKLDSLVAGLRSVVTATKSLEEHLDEFEGLVENASRETQLEQSGSSLTDVRRRLRQDRRRVDRALARLHDDVHQTRLVPISALLSTFPRMVRDLARQERKDVALGVVGDETEIDRAVLEHLKGPLIHLVRNCIDHGLESPEERAAAGKPVEGVVRISASQVADVVVVEVADDGAGIDIDAVKDRAIRRGSITAEQASALSDRDAIRLIFDSGLSTSEIITDLSGRGVGLDVVRDGVERLNGIIEVESRPGRGTTFSLKVPLTIATTRCVLVQVRSQTFALPTNRVSRTVGVRAEDVARAEGRDVLKMDGQPVALANLGDVLGIPGEAEVRARRPALLLASGEGATAFLVDRVIGVEDLVIVPLPPPLPRLQYVAGATLLAKGHVVVVLSPGELAGATHRGPATTGERIDRGPREAPRILVVDDSITTRTLEKNILETAGYKVTVASDGVEGWAMLQADEVDLVVSDLQMPRMDGFELTEKIRSDGRFQHLPVVLVTSLESPEDKRRGIETGADAYIVKSAFDKDRLLDAINRLI